MSDVIRPRLWHLVLLLLVCAAVVGVGVTAASGVRTVQPTVLNTADRPVEPTARMYVVVQP